VACRLSDLIVQFPQWALSAGVVKAEPRIYDPFAASSACAHFCPKRGAIGATTNCENQNLVILGVSDAEIAFASRAIEKLGGYVTVADGEFSPKFRPGPLAV
jgi:Adenine deaminase C-terminal domain